jgi:hypothetical protein
MYRGRAELVTWSKIKKLPEEKVVAPAEEE